MREGWGELEERVLRREEGAYESEGGEWREMERSMVGGRGKGRGEEE